MPDTTDSNLLCHACHKHHKGAKPVTLIDGRVVSSYSKEWMLECEARWVIEKLPDKAKPGGKTSKSGYLIKVEDRRGRPAMMELRALMAALWRSSSAKRRR